LSQSRSIMERQSATKAQKTPTRVNQLQEQSARQSPGEHPFLELQRSIGNQAVQRLIRSPHVPSLSATLQRQDGPPDHLSSLREMLGRTDVPEEEVIALLPQLSPAEKATVTTDAFYKTGMASAFNTGEMVQAVRILGLTLEKQLEWVEAATSASDIEYSEIRLLVTSAPQADRDVLKTTRWQTFFVGVCDNSTIITAVSDLHFDLETQLQWIEEEASPSNLDYSDIQPFVVAA